MNILLDLDGVLADFVKGMIKTHNISNPFTDYRNLGNDELATIFGMTVEELFAPTNNNPEWWENLEKTDEAEAIVDSALTKVGIFNVHILSTPTRCPYSMVGKLNWIKKNFPMLSRNYNFSPKKKIAANPNNVLIDDSQSNCRTFIANGGKAFLVPRPWNVRYKETNHVVESYQHFLLSLD